MADISRRSLLGSAALGLAGQAPAARPNVLFYFADQVRAAELGCNGGKNIPTPHIDRLASQGVSFTNALSTYPLCTPYRAMLQTGRYPALSGGVMNWINLPSTGQSMADVFSAGSYDTGFIGKWHLAAGARAGTLKRSEPPRKLAESEFVPPGPLRHGYQHWAAFNFHANFSKPFYYRDTPERLFWQEYETDAETGEAIRFINGRKGSGKPFFLTVAPHPPHPPWRPGQTPPGYLDKVPKDLHWRPNVKGRMDQPDNDPRCYFAMLANVDDNVGRLMKYLDESGLAENTIFVFTTDHGEMLASQGRYNKMVPYSEAVDIPLIVRWPRRIGAGRKSDTLYTPIDHFPTLASMCGLETPKIVDGMNLSGRVLEGKGPDRDSALMMNFISHWDFPETMTLWPEWRGVRTRQHTYVRWLNGAEELYDNSADPYQCRNLHDGRNSPAVLNRLRSRLKDLLKEAHDEFLPGDRYGEWFTRDRDLIRTALGPVKNQRNAP
ncbi:MAG: sulfatase [Bryobacterales bacterium]|nr:sulfatase [Bryobacterales bacterium]